VTGLGRRQRQADALRIAHLTDQQNLGICTQRIAQPGGEVADIAPNLAPAYERVSAGREGVLDRIFERDHHDRTSAQQLLGERGEGSGFA
jgi:hypothetical protein